MTDKRQRWELMLPWEFEEAIAKLPVCFLPIGTVEWHGKHNTLGLDAVKAHELCMNAAVTAGGGVVHPPLFGGVGGLDKPATVVVEDELTWDAYLLRLWLERMLSEFQRLGFAAVILLTGHYGHNQQITVRETAARMSERLQMPILGTPEYWLALDVGYHGDHAGIGETSIMMKLRPDLVEMNRFEADASYGLGEETRVGSSPVIGEVYCNTITDRMAALARSMVNWDAGVLAGFVDAERAIISAQVRGWRLGPHPWAAWRNLSASGMREYGRLLVEGRFDEIRRLAGELSY